MLYSDRAQQGKYTVYLKYTNLKGPKCEIFDRSDFHDFYTIKSLWCGHFGVEILIKYFSFWGELGII
jgi:hypothetical protein